MELKTNITSDFLKLFYNQLECEVDGTSSKLNLRILKIENNRFCYEELIDSLSNAMITFSLSRKEVEDFKKQDRYGELYRRAASKFKDYSSNEGEAGELLLYCFLESHLGAPKLLTKLEIKTSSNDYVKGSDGIHLLRVDANKYQIVFGESKLEQNLTDSLTHAFKSIYEFTTRPKNNIHDELGLINSQLCKEAFDETLYQFIKSIVFPAANDEAAATKDNAFAIFAGFEIDTSAESKMSNDEFRRIVREKILDEVESKKAHIKKKIDEFKLHNYTFYVYIFPFTKISEDRKKLIGDLIKVK